MTSVSSQPIVRTLQVPDGRLHYEVRGHGPLVALVGAPMDAAAFAPLADLLAADHTVLTTDPRGIGRSPLDDPGRESTPELRADDLSRLITEVDAGPATVLGSSGGACTVLALAQAHPEQIRTAIAHEPPLHRLLDDRDELHAATEDMIDTYLAGDAIGAWGKFMAAAGIVMPQCVLDEMFGGDRDPRVLADERRWFTHELRATAYWEPDLAALRAAKDKIVIGIGRESSGQLCDRASRVLADHLGLEPALFPGGHTGFAEDPDAFVPHLRTLMTGTP